MSEFLQLIELMSSAIFSNLIIRIQSNLYEGILGTDPLLGVDLKSKELNVKNTSRHYLE